MTPLFRQRGYLLITVVVTLFLLASVSMLLAYDSANNAHNANNELEAARAEYVARASLQNALWRTQNNACLGDVTIPTTTLGNDTYSATITGAAAGTFYLLTADQDAWIRNDDPTINNGTTASNHIRFESGNTEHSLTRFDISGLPAQAQILSAVAWFNLKDTKEHAEGPISIHEITADWAETSVTWESFADAYRSASIGMIPAQDVGNVWVKINLTGVVQSWVNGQPNYGILMRSSAEGVHGEYLAREDGTSPPRLEVVVGSGPASPVTIKAEGELDNGVKRALKDKIAIAYQPPGTVTLQLGTDPGADAILDSFYERNYGGQDFVQVTENTGNWVQRSVFRFGLGAVPVGARVISAKFELRLRNIKTPGKLAVHRVTRSWVEGTLFGTGQADGATWQTYDGTNNWASEGGDFDEAAIAETTISGGETWVEWEVGPLVEQWLNGEPNNGLLLKSDGVLEEAEFYSKEETDAALRPKLMITYACECGSPCMAPSGSGNILMVVHEKTWLGPADQVIKSLFEDWGYTIELISAKDNQNTFDGGFIRNNVVFVAESINSTELGNKVNSAPIGVVNSDGWMNDQLGFESADSSNWPVGNSINITDTSHYITAPLVGGSLRIYDADMGGLAIGNTPAPGLQALAAWGTDTGLAVLESGALMADGGSAAGRRVMLPFGRDDSMDWSRLNNSGQLVLQRSLAWGMGAGSYGSGKLLMVVDDASNPIASELARQALIESWGHTVTLISDHASQADFNTALADVDVVYICGSGSSAAVSTKLTAATVGVVTEDIGLSDDLGTAEPLFVKKNSQHINVIDDTHYITSSFGLGTLQLYSYVPEIWTVNGALAPGLQLLGETQDAVSSFPLGLAVLEAGAELWGGGFAAGRRVQVPWAQGSFDINGLNADGLTIFQRVLEWGSGACLNTKPLLLVVGDSDNPSSKDSGWQSQLESWCYEVTLVDDGATQTELEAAAAANDVVYVSGTSSPTTLSDKLADVATPLLNEPMWLLNDLGFSEDEGYNTTYTGFLESDATHYITSPSGGGAVTIFTESRLMGTLHGTMSADLMDLGGFAATPMLAALEIGGQRWDGSPAPARRLHVPFENAEIGQLTPDGLALLRRSIDWATGAGSFTGPLAHWKLDETSGTTAEDSAGDHDGTTSNTTWAPGKVDGGLLFNSSSDSVTVPHADELSITDALTVSAWIYKTGRFGYDPAVVKATTGSDLNYFLGTWESNPVFGFSTSTDGWQGYYATGTTLSEDTWYHLAATYDNAADMVRVYVDGTLAQSFPTTLEPVTNSGNVFLGRSAISEFWPGTLDDVRIYDEVLDEPDIAVLAGASGGGGPVAHWTLDDGSGVTATDVVGGHNGTLTNGPVWTTGQLDSAVRFDGSNDRINVPHDTGLDLLSEMTLSAWVYIDTLKPFQMVLTKGDNGAAENYWLATETNRVNFGFVDGGTYAQHTTTGLEISPGSWHHIAGTFDDAANEVKIYVDGVAETFTNTYTPAPNGERLIIGNSYYGEAFDGVIDDVRINSTVLSAAEIAALAGGGSGGGGGGGGGGDCDGTFRDEFNARSFTGSDGTLTWASDWIEVGESDGPTSGDTQVQTDQSNYQLRTRDNNNGGEGVEREVDLTGASTATLRYDYRRMSLDSTSDYTKVEVSTDGTSWTELARHQGGSNDSSYQPATHDISGYISSTTRIRFLTSSSMGNTDTVWFDNVEIECTP